MILDSDEPSVESESNYVMSKAVLRRIIYFTKHHQCLEVPVVKFTLMAGISHRITLTCPECEEEWTSDATTNVSRLLSMQT